ncbi:MAG: D-tyrosyl-tRNA(Tyr) deacylase [Candidatus Eisenbacteria bacterium]|uniref:D-aminoacyl-tRNA deacylase n=1 Tax=Eiseniibacteriota bacterium TaxID=2212470 RepID=A0A948RW05_UNCEI|nr:D-tyrosyl-tRNA(Tyr) deacylase [Candidatus Eisenbacteria bacterium]MBU1947321.1 D-tyrosyl-tRNA(Tyr) deacylase [Candidatus Eisenbacteria bacterium]MBU2690527.1 D-tyrosyl-tRNA(Tyr) deacylase [Candidatus Eisenbacteria bacterium]
MNAVVQRVSRAEVRVDGLITGSIGPGLLILLGVRRDDGPEDVRWTAEKCASLRIFNDSDGKMNLGLAETGGGILVISQFTLLGDCRKGRRPSFVQAAPPDKAKVLYEDFVSHLLGMGFRVETGVFQAMMDVELVNDGPVTLIIDSQAAASSASDSRTVGEAGS